MARYGPIDPDANLKEQLGLATEALDIDPEELTVAEIKEVIDQHVRLCALVDALSEWISRGGALPAAWRSGPETLFVEAGQRRAKEDGDV